MDGRQALLRGPLGSRNFRLLSACSVISVGGSQIAAVATPFAVLRCGSASDVGYVASRWISLRPW
jgi:hypothetical protein